MELTRRVFRCDNVRREVNILSMTDGRMLFKCKDVAKILGYGRESMRNAIGRHIPIENRYRFEDV